MFNHARLPLITPFFNPKPLSFSLLSTSAIKALPPSASPHHFLSSNAIDLLPLLSSLQSLHQTKQSHALALVFGLLPSSVSLCASLILNYAKFGKPVSCKFLFENTMFYCKTPFLWNTLLRGYSISGVFDVYNHMIRTDVRPDDHTFPCVIKACADHCEGQKGREIHGFSIKVFKYFCNDVTDDGLLRMLRVINKDLKPARRKDADSEDGSDDDDDDLLDIEEAEESDEADAVETGTPVDTEATVRDDALDEEFPDASDEDDDSDEDMVDEILKQIIV